MIRSRAGPCDARIASAREPGIGLADDGEGARRAAASLVDDVARSIGRPVVDQNDLVGVFLDRLIEARVENAGEQRRAVISAELNRRANHDEQ